MKKFILLCTILLSGYFFIADAQVILSIEINTGSDDLRGGNDNVNLIVLMKSGALIRFNNLNLSSRLADNSTYKSTQILTYYKVADIKGFRLQTTLGGGMGGDNWNLNRLTIYGIANNVPTKMIDVSGNPLFRFTGDQKEKDFMYTPAATATSNSTSTSASASASTPSAPAVMTKFNPDVHGFKFINQFKNIFVSGIDWFTGGLCGGMSYAALDYYKSGKKIPQQSYMPAEGMPLQSYLYDRQVNSIVANVDRWAELGATNLFGARNREFFNWGIQNGSGQLGRLMSYIDRGEPVVLGLSSCGDGCSGDHQVIAIGYQLGRYKGDLGYYADDLTIFVCDPNLPGKTVKMRPNFSQGYFYYPEEGSDKRWRTYFVDTKYSPKTPPVITDNPNEIIVTFTTGNDDLRGGKDNVNFFIDGILQPSAIQAISIKFYNVNNGKRWINGSMQTISRPLPDYITLSMLNTFRIETNFSGGLDGDNWDLNGITISARINGVVKQLYKKEGTPIVRFTGDFKSYRIQFQRISR